jgi:hypothetical protein
MGLIKYTRLWIFRIKNWHYYKLDRQLEGFMKRELQRDNIREKLKKLMDKR